MDTLARLITETYRMYQAVAANPIVVRPSIPILYFGDSHAYLGSHRKVITVALNPSRLEFPDADRFVRFPAARQLSTDGYDGDVPGVIRSALDAYFREQPYRRWFDPAFESLLHGLEVSYYGGCLGTALHTDIGSPLATDPTWSRLGNEQRSPLEADGGSVWHRLVAALEPDVILMSVAAHHLRKIQFPQIGPSVVLHTLTQCRDGRLRRKPYVVEQRWFQLPSGKRTRLIFGQAAEKPFGTVSRQDQWQIGRVIHEALGMMLGE